MSTNSLTVELVLDQAGNVDSQASSDAFDMALSAHIQERETQTEQIAEAVTSLFDQYRGTAIQVPTLSGMAAQRLNAQPANRKTISGRVADYVRNNADGKGQNLFQISKGKGGGVKRVSDLPVLTTETASS